MIIYDLGAEVSGVKVPGKFWLQDDEHSLGLPEDVWTATTRTVGSGDKRKEIDVWEAPFLPPHVLVAPPRQSIDYEKRNGRVLEEKYTFPFNLAKARRVHPEYGYALDGAKGWRKVLNAHVMLTFVDYESDVPFLLSLKSGSRYMMLANNLDDAQHSNPKMGWGIKYVLSAMTKHAIEYSEAKSWPTGKHANDGKWIPRYTDYGMWIGTALPMTEKDGSPHIIDFGFGETKAINPFAYHVATEEADDAWIKYCVLGSAYKELNERIGRILEEHLEPFNELWSEEVLLANNAQAKAVGYTPEGGAEEEDDEPPF